MYQAIIAKLEDVRPHPNADRIKLSTVCGEQVVVGLDSMEGDIGIYFPSDGRISIDFLRANNLLTTVDEAGNKTRGYFDEKGRVRTQKFRGEKSDGFWCPLSYLDNYAKFISDTYGEITYETRNLKVGDLISSYMGRTLCERYETPATIVAKSKKGRSPSAIKEFPKHFDTAQLRFEIDNIPEGSLIYISEKLHGTSQRYALVRINLPWYKRLVNRIFRRDIFKPYKFMVGSRNVILESENHKGYYESESFRYGHVNPDIMLPGEVLYGELVGYQNNGKPIMCNHSTDKVNDKAIQKRYGKELTYSYGCKPNECKFYLYHIRHFDEFGREKNLSMTEIFVRAKQLGIEYIQFQPPFYYYGDKESLLVKVNDLLEGPSYLDDTHIREGVVLRIEPPNGVPYFLKQKSFTFRVLEGIAKDDREYVDMEESS